MSKWKEMLKEAKELFDDGLIDEKEYKEMKTEAFEVRNQEKLGLTSASSTIQDTFMGKTSFDSPFESFKSSSDTFASQTGFDFSESKEERMIGQYRLLSKIGSGGMGTVYWARHKIEGFAMQTGDVAIKLMNPDVAEDENYKSRFIAEAGIGRAISHPNITKIHDIIIEERTNTLALVMDLAQGMSLEELIPHTGMSLKQAIPIIEQLSKAVDYIHGEGIIHRDLKPENIIISTEGKVTILDLGIAKNTKQGDSSQTSAGVAMGTPLYMAPEQLDAKNVTSAADRYALGLVVYKMLSGRLPWEKGLASGEILSKKFLERLIPLSEQPENIQKAVSELLFADPEKRTKSCAQFVENLQKKEQTKKAIPEELPEFEVEDVVEEEETNEQEIYGEFQDLDVPDLGEGVEEGTIIAFLKEIGDIVQEGESFVLLEAENGSFEISSNFSGELVEFFFDEGDVVLVGEAIACIDVSTDDVEEIDFVEDIEAEEETDDYLDKFVGGILTGRGVKERRQRAIDSFQKLEEEFKNNGEELIPYLLFAPENRDGIQEYEVADIYTQAGEIHVGGDSVFSLATWCNIPATGRVTEIYCKKGDIVQVGQILARFETTRYRADGVRRSIDSKQMISIEEVKKEIQRRRPQYLQEPEEIIQKLQESQKQSIEKAKLYEKERKELKELQEIEKNRTQELEKNRIQELEKIQAEQEELNKRRKELEKGFFSFMNKGAIENLNQKIQKLETQKQDIQKPVESKDFELDLEVATIKYEAEKKRVQRIKHELWTWIHKKEKYEKEWEKLRERYEFIFPDEFKS